VHGTESLNRQLLFALSGRTTGKKSDLVLSRQLDGDWMTYSHGVPSAFDQDHAKIVLDTIKQSCVPIAEHGVVLFASPDGEPFRRTKLVTVPMECLSAKLQC